MYHTIERMGWTRDDIANAVEEKCGGLYQMDLAGSEADIVHRLVNWGIDSHLESCYVPDRGDSYEWRQLARMERLSCTVSTESLMVLLRRLYEDGVSDESEHLASCILDTLGFEVI